MGKTYGVDANGDPINLIGEPVATSYDPAAIEVKPMKAEKSGIYEKGAYRFWANAGDPIVDDAKLMDERSEKSAPKNRAEKSAPENRAAKKDEKAN